MLEMIERIAFSGILGGLVLILFLISFFCSTFLSSAICRLAPRLGLVDRPGQHRAHPCPMPKGGGIAILLGTLVPAWGAWLLIAYLATAHPALASSLPPLETIYALGRDIILILGGGVIIFALGLIDDLHPLGPWSKIVVELAVAGVLVSQGIRLTCFVPGFWASLLLTSFWLLLITNAFNLLDNMDGLSSGVAFISGSIFLWVAWQTEQWTILFLLLSFLGALLGFWRCNFPPAKIYMGDSGSLFIGYMMATLTIHATFYRSPSPLFPIILPVLVLAVPLFDTLTVILIRRRQRQPIFRGDRNHFSHRLVRLGMSTTQAVLVIYLVTLVTGITATLLYQTNCLGSVIIIGQVIAILLLIHILEQTPQKPQE